LLAAASDRSLTWRNWADGAGQQAQQGTGEEQGFHVVSMQENGASMARLPHGKMIAA
jgi:hypothetical protein